MPLDLEDLLCFRSAFSHGIVDLVQTILLAFDDFVHLLFGDETAVIAESVICQIFAAMVSHLLLLILSLQFFVPKFENFCPPVFLRQRRASHGNVGGAVVRAATGDSVIERLRLLAAVHGPRRVAVLDAILPISAPPLLILVVWLHRLAYRLATITNHFERRCKHTQIVEHWHGEKR